MSTELLPPDWAHTLLVIALFTAMVLAPVLVAVVFGSRVFRRRKGLSSGSIPIARSKDAGPSRTIHHLPPRPRRRRNRL